MDRPSVVCHMALSVDGKTTGKLATIANFDEYFKLTGTFGAEALACGKNSLIDFYGKCPDLSEYKGKNSLGKKDFIKKSKSGKYMICFDRKGSIGWTENTIKKDDFNAPYFPDAQILTILTEEVSDEYLAYCQKIGVSYIISGQKENDLKSVMKKLKEEFGINKIVLEGGSTLNSSFQALGFIDELSLVMLPFIGEKEENPLIKNSSFEEYEFVDHKTLPDKNIWITLKKKQK